jgi:hypothetical protein
MLSSTILKLTDPYEYQTSISSAEDLKCIVTAPGDYQADLMLVDLHQLELQRGSISLPRIVSSAHTNNLCNFCFPTGDQPPVMFNGVEVPQASMAFYSPGAEYYVRSSGECLWGGISLPQESLASAARALVGHEITAPVATRLIRPPPPLMARLLSLHEAANRLAATAPDILAHPEVARAIEQGMLRALIACLAGSAMIKSNPNRQHVLQRFHRVVEANHYEPLYLAEVCAAVGVSEPTLHIVCTEYLGMGAHRYLWLRRMNLVRRALALADPKDSLEINCSA